MEVSNELKEDIRKTQIDLKNAIRIHQVWVARLQDDQHDTYIKTKVKEAEKEILSICQAQREVIDRLRHELSSYQQCLKSRNKQVNLENDYKFVAQQLRDHQVQFKNRNSRPVSLIKPSVLTEIHVKPANNGDINENHNQSSDSESNVKLKHNEKESYNRSHVNSINYSRKNFGNALNKANESLISLKIPSDNDSPNSEQSDSDSSPEGDISPTPSPPPLPLPGETINQETFLRLLGLMTHRQKEMLEKKRRERRKRSTTSTNRNEFIYGNFDLVSKRKKYNQFPYLQSHTAPPQTRSAKHRKEQKGNDKSSREGSPSGSSTETKSQPWVNKPPWVTSLPPGLSVEPVLISPNKTCHVCERNDVPSLLVWCSSCAIHLHTGCGDDGRCNTCHGELPDPSNNISNYPQLFRDTILERKRLQEKNIQLCIQLQNLEARAANLKENIDENHAEKRELLADQINTQRNLQKLLDFINQFKETSLSLHSTSASESGSEISKSN